MSVHRVLSAAVVFGGLMIAAVANAAVVTFTDRSAWEAAVSSFQEVNFNGFPGQPVSFELVGVDVGPFTLLGDSTGVYTDMRINGDRVEANVCSATFCSPAFEYSITFDQPIVAFGADYSNVAGGSGIDFDIGSATFGGPTVNNGFFGFVSTSAFSAIRIFGDNEIHQFDNVVFAAVVPEPGTLALLGLGLAGLAAARRRKQ